MKKIVPGLALALASMTGIAQTTPAPQLVAGDKWVVQVKKEQADKQAQLSRFELTLERVAVRNLLVAMQPLDSNLGKRELYWNPDWSYSIAFAGKEATVRKPFDFPLDTNKTWKLQWEEPGPAAGVKLERNKLVYRVTGPEDIVVPAGTFRAVKVEAEGTWYREFLPRGPSATANVSQDAAGSVGQAVTHKAFTPPPATGRLYQAWWYVPEIKREVKSIMERAAPNGQVLSRETAELEKYTPAH